MHVSYSEMMKNMSKNNFEQFIKEQKKALKKIKEEYKALKEKAKKNK